MKIMVIGSINIDYVYRVARFTQPGVTVSASSLEKGWGGKGLSQSVSIRSGGSDVLLAGCVGRDDSAELLTFLRDKGVDTHLVSRTDKPTGHTIIQVNEAGENSMLNFGGANRAVDGALIDRALDELALGDLLVMQNEIANMPLLLTRARAKGVRMILNVSPVEGALDCLPLETVDLFFLNEHEAKAVARTDTEVENALLGRFPASTFVITYGAKGAAVLAAGVKRLWADAHKVCAVDTTGAGDTFLGYYVSLLAQGANNKECLRYATQASALCVQRPGAAFSIPMMHEVEQALFK